MQGGPKAGIWRKGWRGRHTVRRPRNPRQSQRLRGFFTTTVTERQPNVKPATGAPIPHYRPPTPNTVPGVNVTPRSTSAKFAVRNVTKRSRAAVPALVFFN